MTERKVENMNYMTSRNAIPCSPRLASGPRRVIAASVVAMAAGCVLWPGAASAQTTLSLAVNANDASDEDVATDAGLGVDVYFGPRLDLTLLTLTTELSAGVHDFAGAQDPTVYRAMAGGRLGLFTIVRPSIFAHLGVGHLRQDVLFGTDREGRTNLAGDAGIALDFTILPLVDIGVHGAYNFVAGSDDEDAFEWLLAGAHVTFVFDS
jgi:hypothetical protein